MDKKDPKYESLKSKLLKLSRLADSGDTHEARNAASLLNDYAVSTAFPSKKSLRKFRRKSGIVLK